MSEETNQRFVESDTLDIKTKMDKGQSSDNDDEEDHKPTAQEKKQAEEAQDANDSDDSDDDGPMKKKQRRNLSD